VSRTPDMVARIGAEALLLDAGARAVAVLEAAGVRDVVVFKGASLIGLAWAPGERNMVDVDLLVHPRNLARARTAFLRDDAWTCIEGVGRPLGARVHRAFTVRSDKGALVDVHAHVAQSVRWPLRFDDVLARSHVFTMGRREARRAGVEDAIVIAALNLAKDDYAQHATSLEDISRLAARTAVDWTLVERIATSARARVAVWTALERAGVATEVVARLRPRRAPLVRRAIERAPSSRRLRQATVGALLTDSPARFAASAIAFAGVRAADAALHVLRGDRS
jgi:hypothetical protein